MATFEAENVGELRKEFEISVDEYLLSCKEDGVEPRKPGQASCPCSSSHAFSGTSSGVGEV